MTNPSAGVAVHQLISSTVFRPGYAHAANNLIPLLRIDKIDLFLPGEGIYLQYRCSRMGDWRVATAIRVGLGWPWDNMSIQGEGTVSSKRGNKRETMRRTPWLLSIALLCISIRCHYFVDRPSRCPKP